MSNRMLRGVVCATAAAGVLVMARVIADLPRLQLDVRLLLLAVCTIASGRFSIKVPGRAASVGVSEVFVFATIFLFGASAATLIVAIDGVFVALTQRRQPIYRAVFNVAEPALSTWMAGFVFGTLWALLPHDPALRLLSAQVPTVAMTAAYFLLNSALTSGVLALESGTSISGVWRQHAPILAVNYYAAASLATLGASGGPNLSLAVIGMVVPLLALSYVAYKEAATREEAGRRHVDDLEHLYQATVETLAIAVDAKDQVTHGHIRRVQRHSLALAMALGMNDERDLKALKAAALLHDVGKLCVPDHVLNKPGALKPAEFHTMKLHATQGATILSTVEFPYPVVPIVRHHHEAWNGRGYPDGLSGEQIPFGARILAVVDCFDALTSDRPYRRKLRDDQALQMIIERSGSAYDPRIVERFVAIVPELRRQDRLAELAGEENAPAPTSIASAATGGWQSTVDTARVSGTGASINTARLAGKAVLAKLVQQVPDAEACLFAVCPAGDLLLPAAATPLAQMACENTAFPIGTGLSGWVAANRHTIVNSDPSLDFGDRATQFGLQSATSTPVFAFATVAAVLTVYMPRRGAFSDRVVRTIGVLAQEVGMEFVNRDHPRVERSEERGAHVRVAG
ncbi:MAG TPA: HD domain-containing phosphohydrolase [Vicinamibacterales bacterium]|nr:HD domain-containing phosphohydrolase [Vicinamibacterales bacterium]